MILLSVRFIRSGRRSGLPCLRNGWLLALITSRGTRSAIFPLIDRRPLVVLWSAWPTHSGSSRARPTSGPAELISLRGERLLKRVSAGAPGTRHHRASHRALLQD